MLRLVSRKLVSIDAHLKVKIWVILDCDLYDCVKVLGPLTSVFLHSA